MTRALTTTLLAVATLASAAFAMEPVKAPGAKGMFYQQLERPAEKMNNGVQYWIELKRGGKITRVSNKFEFRTNDQIRLHVRANIDGYAYVVLKEGSRGEQAVLFPDPRHADDNHIKANVEYTIPGDSYLMFDQFPGTERVMLVLARNPVQPLRPENVHDKVVVASSRIEGSKDLIPGSFVVSYGNGNSEPAPYAAPSTTPPPVEIPVVQPTVPDDNSAIITVVQKNAADALALEICLEHKP